MNLKYEAFIISLTLIFFNASGQKTDSRKSEAVSAWNKIEQYFSPPPEYKNNYGKYRSPLTFYDGSAVRTASDWKKRRKEILNRWNGLMGEWPSFITDQEFQIVKTEKKDGYTLNTVEYNWLPGQKTQGYLLIPEGTGKKPGVITVFYEPETAAGFGRTTPNLDFALQLAKRGFVTLSIGTTETTNSKTYSLYFPDIKNSAIQPLSVLAYAAANSWYALSKVRGVDPDRIGIMGLSYGGKWSMFSSCLFEKFACGVWMDPGIVFDESQPSTNYWEPWYLGYYPPPWNNTWRKTGMIPEAKGLYPKLMNEGYDLHELHALMAPRPFLVSGGNLDTKARWTALNHSVIINKLLGYENRVAMTNRPTHLPDAEADEQAFLFLEYFLKYNGIKNKK